MATDDLLELFMHAVRTSVDGINITDLRGNILFSNKASEMIYGYQEGELTGKHVNILNWNKSISEEIIIPSIMESGSWSGEIDQRKKDNTIFPASVTTSLIKNSSGKPLGMIGVVRDVSKQKEIDDERRNLEEKIRHTQKLESIGALAGGLAHELNNILTGIIGYNELAMMRLEKGSPVRELLSNAQQSAGRAADILKQLLAYSGKGMFFKRDLDISAEINKISDLIRLLLSKKIKLKTTLSSSLPKIHSDADQIRQLVLNLCSNAAESIDHDRGQVEIITKVVNCDLSCLKKCFIDHTSAIGRFLMLEVRDNGSGIEPGMTNKIFDPFFSTKFIGRGLGLAAVEGIIRANNGALMLESKTGKGSSFKVFFPFADEENHQTVVGPGESRTDKKEILVIDDEHSIRQVVSLTLENSGLTALTTADGEEGLRIFQERHHTLKAVLLDFTMPGPRGDKIFHKMKNINPGVPVIILSGHSENELKQYFTEEKPCGFIQKPFRPSTLISQFEKLIAIWQTTANPAS